MERLGSAEKNESDGRESADSQTEKVRAASSETRVPAEDVAVNQKGKKSEGAGEETCNASVAVTTGDELKLKEMSELRLSDEDDDSVAFEISSTDGDGPHRLRLHLETPERATTPPQPQGVHQETTTTTTSSSAKESLSFQESVALYRGLRAEREQAGQRSSLLQMKLAEHFHKKAGEEAGARPDRGVATREYEERLETLRELKQQNGEESEGAERQLEELRSRSRRELEQVAAEWSALKGVKREVGVAALAPHWGRLAAQSRVAAVLESEQLQHDELVKLRLKHIKLRMRTARLEAELCDREGRSPDPLQLRFQQLQADGAERRRQAERQREESAKLQRKISSSLELLTNVKERLHQSRQQLQAQREQLAQLEAGVALRRGVLTRCRGAGSRLQGHNLRLREGRGLLGSRVLLRDLEDTADANDQLEDKLEELKWRWTCAGGRWRHVVNQ